MLCGDKCSEVYRGLSVYCSHFPLVAGFSMVFFGRRKGASHFGIMDISAWAI